ncbi:MAG: carboxylesterase family protein [Maricaulaceae bacterium]
MRSAAAALAASALTACAAGTAPTPLTIAESAPVVQTRAGAVAGTHEDGLAVFRGVPFAAAPVGDLRWAAPSPVAAWEGVRAADAFAPACYQASGPAAGGVAENQSSEDCLYLNVWTPAETSSAGLPVMVWIYGGGFSAGATSTSMYSGERLAERGVVVVSIAYRVGPMGYLAHPELSAESSAEVSGNYGLLDQIAGLEWVQDNVEAFGGDPDKVTIFGESAGGISVSMLAASPLAEGLFRGAISESGGSFGATHSPPLPGENVQRLDQAEAAGLELQAALEASGLADMRAATAAAVQTAARGVQGVSWPVMDGYVIPDDQHRLYEAGAYNDVDVLIGFNSDEGALFGGPVGTEAHEAGVRDRYGPFADEILETFSAASETDATQASRDLATDVMFGWHTVTWAELQSQTGEGDVYLYYFDQKPPYPEGNRLASVQGAPHAAELAYVFDHLDLQPTMPWREEDRAMAAAMATYWTNFAKTGDPNGGGLPEWPRYAAGNPQAMIFRGTPSAGALPDPAHFDVLTRYFAWRRSPGGAQP